MHILLIDDHTLFREALLHVLRQLDTDVIVFEAASVEEAARLISHVRDLDLDLVLLDIDLPDTDGMSYLPSLRAAAPDVPIVLLSGSEAAQHVKQARHYGAVGYLSKSCSSHEMLAALHIVLQGDVYWPPKLLDKLTSWPSSQANRHTTPVTLTVRQKEVLTLMVQGLPNKSIANQLQVTEGTVKLHVAAILHTLGVCNRTQAVTEALRLELVIKPLP